MNYIYSIAEHFKIDSITNIECICNGKINNTYKITTNTNKYILQKINKNVFKNPYKVNENIESITKWLKTKNIEETLETVRSKDNKLVLEINENGEKEYYRLFNFIENKVSYNETNDRNIIYLVGKAFGNFEKLLIDYPKHKLEKTIKDFHNTEKIYEKFLNNIKTNKNIRILEIQEEIELLKSNVDIIYHISSLIEKNLIPKRVIHGDTKISNVMINSNEQTFTVIDLDTIMIGTILYDYGDGIRSISEKTCLNDSKFESYTDGYLSEMASILTKEEINNMGISIELVTLELAIRYLDDYVNNDVYFKTNYDKENLDRAIDLFKLFTDIKNKMPYINEYIIKTINKYIL